MSTLRQRIEGERKSKRREGVPSSQERAGPLLPGPLLRQSLTLPRRLFSGPLSHWLFLLISPPSLCELRHLRKLMATRVEQRSAPFVPAHCSGSEKNPQTKAITELRKMFFFSTFYYLLKPHPHPLWLCPTARSMVRQRKGVGPKTEDPMSE